MNADAFRRFCITIGLTIIPLDVERQPVVVANDQQKNSISFLQVADETQEARRLLRFGFFRYPLG